MYKAVIIEDEKYAAGFLAETLKRIAPDFEISAIWESVEESKEKLNKVNPDIVFADIQLEDGLSFSIFEDIRWVKPVVFITAYDSYALRAFKVNGIDYLLKPVDEESLEAALVKFRNNYHSASFENLFEKLKGINLSTANYKERFAITIGTRIYSVPVNEVAYFVFENKTVYLVSRNGQKLPYGESMEKLMILLNPADFFRINRNYIINHPAIKKINLYSGRNLSVDLNPATAEGSVYVSKDRITEFKLWLDK